MIVWIETDYKNEIYFQNVLHGYCGAFTYMLLTNAGKKIFFATTEYSMSIPGDSFKFVHVESGLR